MKIHGDFLSVTDAAELMGITTGRVRQMLRDGSLSGKKIGLRAWLVSRESAAKSIREPASVGRPRSAAPAA